jgi:FAD/FMN-containing dehydrogenase
MTASNPTSRNANTTAAIPSLDPTPEIFSWGRYPRVEHRAVYKLYWADQVAGIIANSGAGSCLPYGLGRSYGDSCLNAGRTLIDCSRLDRILAFDRQTGRICCEAGVSLADILQVAVPAGWFLPVTPGTKFVTVGGAIANDVHGKNHHRAGTFGRHVQRLYMYRSDLGELDCTPNHNEDLFRATIGGLGLTGVILAAEIQLKPIAGDRIETDSIPFRSLAEFQALAEESDNAFEYTVAWVDCFSARHLRGIFIRGNHAPGFHNAWTNRSGPRVPFAVPDLLLNRHTLKLFNSAYFHLKSRRGKSARVPLDGFFYPLDAIRQWNLLYGSRGFLQYQCVIPETEIAALEGILAKIAGSGLGSFLAVLKRFGTIASPGMLSFPRPGLTLALDFPMAGEHTLQLLRDLDEIAIPSGGAVYPAKDARMDSRAFEASFPAWREFERYRDPVLSSTFWRRVTGGASAGVTEG